MFRQVVNAPFMAAVLGSAVAGTSFAVKDDVSVKIACGSCEGGGATVFLVHWTGKLKLGCILFLGVVVLVWECLWFLRMSPMWYGSFWSRCFLWRASLSSSLDG